MSEWLERWGGAQGDRTAFRRPYQQEWSPPSWDDVVLELVQRAARRGLAIGIDAPAPGEDHVVILVQPARHMGRRMMLERAEALEEEAERRFGRKVTVRLA